jgi:hypothetical protein
MSADDLEEYWEVRVLPPRPPDILQPIETSTTSEPRPNIFRGSAAVYMECIDSNRENIGPRRPVSLTPVPNSDGTRWRFDPEYHTTQSVTIARIEIWDSSLGGHMLYFSDLEPIVLHPDAIVSLLLDIKL